MSFPKLFQGLGTLKGEYQIQLMPDAKPHTLYTARNIPIPLRVKVKQELRSLECYPKWTSQHFGVLE